MELIAKETTGYKNDRVELSKMKSGRYYISNGCQPLGFAEKFTDAIEIYHNQVKRFKAKYTRELNKTKKFIRENIETVDAEAVREVMKNDFHIAEESINNMFKYGFN